MPKYPLGCGEEVLMKLTRLEYRQDGIFGQLQSDDGSFRCQTLEHAYFENGSYTPKVAAGIYTCVRGEHELLGMTTTFTTFELQNVPPFQGKPVTGILIHWGNYNKDSEGCILVGLRNQDDKMILDSKIAFEAFMAALDGQDQFTLIVE